MRRPLLYMRKRGLFGSMFGRHANIGHNSLTKSAGRFIELNAYIAAFTDMDGTTDYLKLSSQLTGVSDGQVGTISLVMDMHADGVTGALFEIGAGATGNWGVYLQKTSQDRIKCTLRNAALAIVHEKQSAVVDTITQNDSRVHVMAAWDTSVPRLQIWTGHVESSTDIGIPIIGTVDYTHTETAIGASGSGTLLFNGCISELYVNLAAEITDTSLFADGYAPKNIGADGSGPTGTPPIIYIPDILTGANEGSAQDFAVNGTPVTQYQHLRHFGDSLVTGDSYALRMNTVELTNAMNTRNGVTGANLSAANDAGNNVETLLYNTDTEYRTIDVIFAGINDILDAVDEAAGDVALANMQTTVNGMITTSAANGRILIFIGMTPWTANINATAWRIADIVALRAYMLTKHNGATVFYHDPSTAMESAPDSDILAAAYDSGDGLHFTTAGKNALAASIHGDANLAAFFDDVI